MQYSWQNLNLFPGLYQEIIFHLGATPNFKHFTRFQMLGLGFQVPGFYAVSRSWSGLTDSYHSLQPYFFPIKPPAGVKPACKRYIKTRGTSRTQKKQQQKCRKLFPRQAPAENSLGRPHNKLFVPLICSNPKLSHRLLYYSKVVVHG